MPHFASGNATKDFPEDTLTKEIVENPFSKKINGFEKIKPDLLMTALENHKAQTRHDPPATLASANQG
jgi:hypothetical protein